MSELDDFYALIGLIQQNYPEIHALLNKPGVLEVALEIIKAKKAGEPWSQAQINAALQRTPYYATTSAAGREWAIRQALDPATAKAMFMGRVAEIDYWAKANGLTIGQDQLAFITNLTLENGESPEIWQRNILNSLFGQMDMSRNPAADQALQMAAQYGVPLSDQTIRDWARQMMTGEVNAETFQSYLIEQAKSLYPGLSDVLDAGTTVRQYADPYAQIASRELGINPNDFLLSDPKWGAALQQVDQNGARTAMTLQSWQALIRSDPAYGYDTTVGARDQAAQFATNIAEQFGAFG